VCIRLTDPRELELPDVGPVLMDDAETGEQLYVDTSDAGFRRRYQAAVEAREAGLRDAFRRAGVDALACRPMTTWSRRSSGWPRAEAGTALTMSFIWPPLLLLLLLVPVGVWAYRRRERQRAARAAGFGIAGPPRRPGGSPAGVVACRPR
jgi:hypothetical protein